MLKLVTKNQRVRVAYTKQKMSLTQHVCCAVEEFRRRIDNLYFTMTW